MLEKHEEQFPELPMQWRDHGYEIDQILGQGAYGAVYRLVKNRGAENEEFSALKVISWELSKAQIREYDNDLEKARRNFSRLFNKAVNEVSILESLAGEAHIVQLKGSCIEKMPEENYCRLYMQMEYLMGLPDYMEKEGVLDEAEIIRMGIEICRALEVCHKHDILHRDIKPNNILVSADGEFKLGDFGLAREWVDSSMTVIGTRPYLAPEVVRFMPYDKRADIYSLGMTLYYLVNDFHLPFADIVDPEERMQKRVFGMDGLPQPGHAFEGMREVIAKACAYDPEERYPTATQMRKALEKVSKAPYGYCPQCGKKLLKKTGPYGEFLGCSGFRKNKPDSCNFHSGIDRFLHQLNEEQEESGNLTQF